MKIAAVFSVFFFALMAFEAQGAGDPLLPDLTLQWDTPTLREDGQPLLGSDIQGYKIYHSVDGGAENITNVPAGTNSYTFNDIAYGEHTFQISTVAETEGQRGEMVIQTVTEIIEPKAPTVTRLILERCDESSNCTTSVLFEGVQ